MNERTPVSAYRLLSSPSIKQKLYVNSRRTPCTFKMRGNNNVTLDRAKETISVNNTSIVDA